MDVLTNEDRVLNILQSVPGVATLPIKSVRIGRDPLNNISRGVCYLDMNNTNDAMRLFAGLSDVGRLEIDGREGNGNNFCLPETNFNFRYIYSSHGILLQTSKFLNACSISFCFFLQHVYTRRNDSRGCGTMVCQ